MPEGGTWCKGQTERVKAESKTWRGGGGVRDKDSGA